MLKINHSFLDQSYLEKSGKIYSIKNTHTVMVIAMNSRNMLRPKFKAQQLIVEIGGVRIGGKPGDNPTLLVGSIFYRGDKLLIDEVKGVIDKELSKKIIEDALNTAEEYGLRFALDVIFPTLESVDNILPFISELNIPILFLDSPDSKARIKAYSLSRELGLTHRVVANGIYVNIDMDEVEALKENGISNAVLLAFDPSQPNKSMYPKDRLSIVRKLLDLARSIGIKGILVDAVVLDPASIGLSASTIYLIKNELGYPSGCAPANALGLVSKSYFSVEEVTGIHGGIAVFLRVMGADFIMYGPVKRIKYVAPAIAVVDGLLGYLAKLEGTGVQGKHPLKTLLKRIQQLFVKT